MWRHVCLVAALLTSACSQILGIEDFKLTDAGTVDTDGPPDAQLCWGAGLAGNICLTMPPGSPMPLTAAIDTAAPGTCTVTVTQTNGPELCVIGATQISVASAVTVTGARPLVLLASDTITIDATGTLDVSSRRTPARVGAGANAMQCAANTAPLNNASGAGGGAGGTFGTRGASGGDGNTVNNNGTSAAVGTLTTVVRGGCRGSDGGDSAAQGGTGGAGGGAVYLLAGTRITVTGNIFASAAGAGASGLRGGGGGGGSGGLIGLEAPMIDVTGIIAANGASGSGGGGGTTGGAAAADGTTTTFSTQSAAATGGTTGGGAGGRGAAAALAATIGGAGTLGAAGGGGGGGAGVVYVKGTFTGTMVSPAPTVAP